MSAQSFHHARDVFSIDKLNKAQKHSKLSIQIKRKLVQKSSQNFPRIKILTKHDPMPVRRAQAEFAHAPGFVGQGFSDAGGAGSEFLEQGFRVCDREVSEVGMVAGVSGGWGIGAFAQHDGEAAARQEAPAGVLGVDPHAQEVAVKRDGDLEALDCQDGAGFGDHGALSYGDLLAIKECSKLSIYSMPRVPN
jgi:hypothetical protein